MVAGEAEEAAACPGLCLAGGAATTAVATVDIRLPAHFRLEEADECVAAAADSDAVVVVVVMSVGAEAAWG